MKIAVFHNLPPGGAKRTVYEEVKYLSKKHTLDLFEFDTTDENFLDVRGLVTNVHRFPFEVESRLPGFLARLEKDYQNFVKLANVHRKIAAAINKGGYDLVLVHADKFTQSPFLLRYLTIPSLYFCQEWLRIAYEQELEFKEDVVFFKRWYEQLTRSLRRQIDKSNAQASQIIIANSIFTKNNIQKVYSKEAVVCHLGADTELFKPSSKKKKNYILFIGEKSEVQGYPLVKSAVKLIEGNIRPEIKDLGSSQGRLKITDDRILAREYSSAIATLCTSYNEPFGIVPLESMSCRTPVLAIDEGGYRETVIPGKTGFLLKRDSKEFAKKIVYLIKHPKKAADLGSKGREHVIDNFSWEKHNKNLERLLINVGKSKLQ